jgi:hypothetical protein
MGSTKKTFLTICGTLILGLSLLVGCSSPSRFENSLIGPQAPVGNQKKMVLTFERESNFAILSQREVTIEVQAPATLVSPQSNQIWTDSAGQVELLIDPVAIYDRSALKSGDIVVDYPVQLTVALTDGSTVYEWDLDGHDSFARYQDPLYRGLDRDPDPTTLNLTLTIP